MSTLRNKAGFSALAEKAEVVDDKLIVDLVDGRTISVPVSYFPRLQNATPEQRKKVKIFAGGEGLEWEDIDEHLSVEGLLKEK